MDLHGMPHRAGDVTQCGRVNPRATVVVVASGLTFARMAVGLLLTPDVDVRANDPLNSGDLCVRPINGVSDQS